MASEYLKWKYRDVKPNPPPKPLTPKEKLANWFYYYKWWLLAGAVLLAILGSILWTALTQVTPDYIVAYVGSHILPEEQTEALERALEELGVDANGDGRVVAEVRSYVAQPSNDPEVQMFAYASGVTLAADMTAGESYFFLMEDPADVQLKYEILAMPDGSPSEDGDHSVEGKVYLWSDCPVLAALKVDQETFSGLYLGRRSFYEGAGDHTACAQLWDKLTEGAKK